MKRPNIRTLWLLLVLLILVFTASTVYADHEGHRHQRRGRVHSKHNHSAEPLKPVSDPLYAEQCGTCHFAYQPELLPAASWRKILDSAHQHFGEAVNLEPVAKEKIVIYLVSNAAETSSAKLSQKIMRCLNGLTPLKITDIPYIRRKHNKILSRIIKAESAGSLSNCVACHLNAQQGIYDDSGVAVSK